NLGRIGCGQGINVFLHPSCQSASGGRAIMSKRILVVEDQEDNRRILRDLLTNAGYEIIEAENGEEALAVAARERPDLILMDIQLPLLEGYEVTRRIKADPALRSIPIIAITSYALSGDESKHERRGAMPTSPNHIARARCWPRSGSMCHNGCFGALIMNDPPRILVVDDNEMNRDIIVTRLERHS